MRHWLWIAALLLVPVDARPDLVRLNSGGEIEGEVVQESDVEVVVRLRFGTIRLARAQVRSIERRETPEQEYARRSAALRTDDLAARLELADWARARGLEPEAAREYLAVWEIAPETEAALRGLSALGWTRHQDRWLTADEYYAAIGWERHEGRWMHPLEHTWRLAVEAADAAATEARRATDAAEAADRAWRDALRQAEAAQRDAVACSARRVQLERERDEAVVDVQVATGRLESARQSAAWAQHHWAEQQALADRGLPNRLDAARLELDRALQAVDWAERRAGKAGRALTVRATAVDQALRAEDAAAAAIRGALETARERAADTGPAELRAEAARAERERCRAAAEAQRRALDTALTQPR